MSLIHIVLGEFERETIILGVYPIELQAQTRRDFIKVSPDYTFTHVWYQVVDVDADGGDCYLRDDK